MSSTEYTHTLEDSSRTRDHANVEDDQCDQMAALACVVFNNDEKGWEKNTDEILLWEDAEGAVKGMPRKST